MSSSSTIIITIATVTHLEPQVCHLTPTFPYRRVMLRPMVQSLGLISLSDFKLSHLLDQNISKLDKNANKYQKSNISSQGIVELVSLYLMHGLLSN